VLNLIWSITCQHSLLSNQEATSRSNSNRDRTTLNRYLVDPHTNYYEQENLVWTQWSRKGSWGAHMGRVIGTLVLLGPIKAVSYPQSTPISGWYHGWTENASASQGIVREWCDAEDRLTGRGEHHRYATYFRYLKLNLIETSKLTSTKLLKEALLVPGLAHLLCLLKQR
jgi:hypothetical protein